MQNLNSVVMSVQLQTHRLMDLWTHRLTDSQTHQLIPKLKNTLFIANMDVQLISRKLAELLSEAEIVSTTASLLSAS